jgi:hypothetical protein
MKKTKKIPCTKFDQARNIIGPFGCLYSKGHKGSCRNKSGTTADVAHPPKQSEDDVRVFRIPAERGFMMTGEELPPEPLPPKQLTEEEALELLWSAKGAFLTDPDGTPRMDEHKKLIPNPRCANVFVYATTGEEVQFREWNGNHPVEKNTETYKRPAGTRVLVTMVSRFGDVGIRDHDLVPPSNGYDARVMPEQLKDWSTRP